MLMSRVELMDAVGIKDRVSFSRNYLDKALEVDLIERTDREPNTK
jgi:Fic/DOC family protein